MTQSILSLQIVRSAVSSIDSDRPIQSVVDDTARSPSPPRPIPSLDSDNFGEHSTPRLDLRDDSEYLEFADRTECREFDR
jgi:hypothetical protein